MASLLSCTAERERELTAKDGHVGVEAVESRIALEKVMESSVRSYIPQGSNSEEKHFATHVRREPRRENDCRERAIHRRTVIGTDFRRLMVIGASRSDGVRRG